MNSTVGVPVVSNPTVWTAATFRLGLQYDVLHQSSLKPRVCLTFSLHSCLLNLVHSFLWRIILPQLTDMREISPGANLTRLVLSNSQKAPSQNITSNINLTQTSHVKASLSIMWLHYRLYICICIWNTLFSIFIMLLLFQFCCSLA